MQACQADESTCPVFALHYHITNLAAAAELFLASGSAFAGPFAMPSPHNTTSDPHEETGAGSGPRPGSGNGSAQKRPAWETSNDRASKRRASKACLSCRNRKVRCDVVSGGHPCTNCRLDKLDCVVRESHRGRRPNAAPSARPASESPPPVEPASPTPPRCDPPRTRDTPPAGNSPGNRPSDYLVSLSFEGESRQQRLALSSHLDRVEITNVIYSTARTLSSSTDCR